MNTHTDIASVVNGYIAVFNEADTERRRALIAETFTSDATYLDPLMSGDGADGIDAMVAGVHQQFPGHRFELTQGPDAHHDRVRFAWRLVAPGGEQAVGRGVDFATVAGDGRLRAITGFLEPAA
jgi:SnoaL-like domain